MNKYTRRDVRIDIFPAGVDALMRRTDPDGRTTEAGIPRVALDRASDGDDTLLRSVLARVAAATPPQPSQLWSFALDRVALSVGERAWAAIDWEGLADDHPGLIRVTDVLARVRTIPLTFPLRVLESGGRAVVGDALKVTFGDADRSQSLLDAAVGPNALADHPAQNRWPTVDVLHLRDDSIVLTPASGLQPWLAPFFERYQTRLVIVECSAGALGLLRRFAQTIVERAGPAVWLFPAAPKQQVWEIVYGDLSHDRPLDWIRAHLAATGPKTLPTGALFVGGTREELLRYSVLGQAASALDATRMVLASPTFRGRLRGARSPPPSADEMMSIAAQALAESAAQVRLDVRPNSDDLGHALPQRLIRFGAGAAARMAERGVYAPGVEDAISRLRLAKPSLSDLARAAVEQAVSLDSLGPAAAEAAVARALREVGTVSDLEFEHHESDGMLPLAAKLAVARNLARQLGGLQGPQRGAARHVNIKFFAADGDAPLRRIEQRTARLRPGELIHLGVQIGMKDELIVTLGNSALVEEIDRSKAELALEVGVSGLDFEVVGDPVQTLLLEPGLPSDLLTFAVRPAARTTVPGVARLRVSIFRDNHLVQSFLVAALLAGTEVPANTALASALGVDAGEIEAKVSEAGPIGYVQRLEFSMAAAPDAGSLRKRGLTLVANDSGGEKVVTVKSTELFHVYRSANFATQVQDLRKMLDRITVDQIGIYGYMAGGVENAGEPGALGDVLWPLASAGWDLCFALLPNDEDREAVRRHLLEDGGLQAAHIVASDVIPWSLVYDRPVRSYAQAMAAPAAAGPKPKLCRAGIPGADEDHQAADCGQRAACLLHQQQQAERAMAGLAPLEPADVVCPLRFWGYRVPIEVPAHQARGIAGRPAQGVQTTIAAGTPLRFAAAFNPNLKQFVDHRKRLDERLAELQATLVELKDPQQAARQDVLDLLAQRDLDLVYLYCHGIGRTQTAAGSLGPGLDFGKAHDPKQPNPADLIPAPELGRPTWDHAPLVFMNGCSTAGFSPYAPSELVLAFVQGRHAAAVVGTEVTVWEMLAREFAMLFFEAFLGRRQNAGAALLAARRTLLAKNNPLGLVYTLYGSSNLTLRMTPAAAAAGRPVSASPLVLDVQAPREFAAAKMGLEALIEASPLLRLPKLGEPPQASVYCVAPRADVRAGDPVPELGAVTQPVWAVVEDGIPFVPTKNLRETSALIETLEREARFRTALGIANPSPDSTLRGKVDFRLLRLTPNGVWEPAEPEDASGQVVFEDGDRIAFEIHNRHSTAIYVSVLDFGLSRAIGLIHPVEGASEKLEAGRGIRVGVREEEEIALSVPESFQFIHALDPRVPVGGTETFKLFATSHETDFSLLIQEGHRRGDVLQAEGAESPVHHLLSMALTGQGTREATGPVRGPPREEWTTVERTFFLRRKSL